MQTHEKNMPRTDIEDGRIIDPPVELKSSVLAPSSCVNFTCKDWAIRVIQTIIIILLVAMAIIFVGCKFSEECRDASLETGSKARISNWIHDED